MLVGAEDFFGLGLSNWPISEQLTSFKERQDKGYPWDWTRGSLHGSQHLCRRHNSVTRTQHWVPEKRKNIARKYYLPTKENICSSELKGGILGTLSLLVFKQAPSTKNSSKHYLLF
uniref:Uncharacterized protein n=1 Tax=Micrurus spixii TaxID=129469 RepID=A0A2D4LGJ5_9SAUR